MSIDVKRWPKLSRLREERGQTLVLFALALSSLVLALGLAVDLGFAYVTKAKLSKSVDAACLTAMRNLAQGQTTATTLATNSFNANYRATSLDANPPALAINFSTDVNGQTFVTVNATATIKTQFMALLPEYLTLPVSDSAQATRGKLVMSLVLDRSGSMQSNGGASALPPAVGTFVNYFDNTSDEVAMVSFASNATVDVGIATNFITPITNAANALSGHFSGGTFGPGGLTLAKSQNESVPVIPGQNVVKVAVYFTDGYVNVIQDNLSCSGTMTLYNYGGYDSGNSVDFFDPTTGSSLATATYSHSSFTWSPSTFCLKNLAGFTSQTDGTTKTFTRTNVTADAQYRALATANAMRAEGMYIYAIGLGSSVDDTFLQQIANDPASSSYNSAQPEGMAVLVPNCPSSTCSSDLQQVFQTIAAQILLRLTQ
ncbi:MAG: vWA domain-containing protein [Candidatus Korobacteraceae bacterium]